MNIISEWLIALAKKLESEKAKSIRSITNPFPHRTGFFGRNFKRKHERLLEDAIYAFRLTDVVKLKHAVNRHGEWDCKQIAVYFKDVTAEGLFYQALALEKAKKPTALTYDR